MIAGMSPAEFKANWRRSKAEAAAAKKPKVQRAKSAQELI
jgi:hypothetical protein